MLQKLSVGPPMAGAADLKAFAENAKKDFKGSGSESNFGKALDEKIAREPKQTRDTAQTERRDKEPDRPEAKVKQPEGRKKASGRQQAIKDFMDSFESEFKIPSTRLVEAMAQLDDSQLKQSPELTAEAVIAELGLDEGESEKAQAMYASLLVQLNQTPVPKAVPEMTTAPGLSAQSAQARILAAQGKQDSALASVDRVNHKFWSQQPKSSQAMPNPLGQNMELEAPAQTPQLTAAAVPPEMPLKELPPHLQGQMADVVSPSLLAALAAKQAEQQRQASEGLTEDGVAESDLGEEFRQALQAPKVEKPAGETAAGLGAVAAKSSAQSAQDYSQHQYGSQNSSQFAAPSAETASTEKSAANLDLSDFKQSLDMVEGPAMEAVHGAPIKGESLRAEFAAPVTVAGAAAPQAGTAADQEAAVKQIMNQAQYLITKGGGEMKVEMSPEGMGTIHLKVMLQDGKVNMQMSAETTEAKKVIESSLAELKTSLAAHKLSMENVKVDVVNTTSTDTATQNQNQSHLGGQGQQNRETRQFWNQFNDNFGSQDRRESFAAMPSLRGYGQKSRDPLQPVETSPPARRVDGKGSGLNLVA